MNPNVPSAAETGGFDAMGRAALAAGDAARAVTIFAQAILDAPLDAHLHANIAAAYLALDRLADAEAHARRAARLDPTLPEAHHNLGNALFAQGDADGALAAFDAARSLAPDAEAHWTNFLFAQTFAEGMSAAAIAAENCAWGARIERSIGLPARPLPIDRDPDRRLRLAYVLPEFDSHVTARFLAPLLAAHDRVAFKISVYGHRLDGGGVPPRLAPEGVRWIDTGGRADGDVAAMMRADGIDVLIHPCTFKARYRTLLALRAAPLQIAGINFVSTTGLRAVDYLIGDPVLMPLDLNPALLSERPLRLPVFNCYGAPDLDRPVTPLPAGANGYITFGSLNNPAKLGPQAVACWAGVLARVPHSRLLLKHRAFDDATVRERWMARFADHGVAPDRLSFAGFTADAGAYLAAYDAIDIALDPMPFNGGTTTYEAIWMGVPVLTVAGTALMARQTASLMTAVGHPEFITNSKQAFLDKAFELSGNLDRLTEVRLGLRAAAAHTIFDGDRYTRSLERAVRTAWRSSVAGL